MKRIGKHTYKSLNRALRQSCPSESCLAKETQFIKNNMCASFKLAFHLNSSTPWLLSNAWLSAGVPIMEPEEIPLGKPPVSSDSANTCANGQTWYGPNGKPGTDWKRRRSLSKPGTTCVCGRVSGQRSQLARMGGLSHTAPLRWGKPLDAEWKHGKTRGRNDHLYQISECLHPVPTLAYDIGDAKVFLGESGDLACLPGEMKPEAWSRNFCGPSYPPELLGWLHSPQALAAGFAQCVRVEGGSADLRRQCRELADDDTLLVRQAGGPHWLIWRTSPVDSRPIRVQQGAKDTAWWSK